MSAATAGHGALFAAEAAPVVPGTFVDVAELNSGVGHGTSRSETNVTPHNDTIATWVVGVLTQEAITFSVNFIFDNVSHDAVVGLQTHMNNGTKFGIRFRGPGGGASSDEVIFSGHLTNFSQTAPVREGHRSADLTFRPSGPYIVDGVTIGTVAL